MTTYAAEVFVYDGAGGLQRREEAETRQQVDNDGHSALEYKGIRKMPQEEAACYIYADPEITDQQLEDAGWMPYELPSDD